MATPLRTCAGCGRCAAQTDLVRFAAVGRTVRAGRTLPGRGVYTCRDAACFDLAVQRHAFTRVLRRPVTPEPELRRIYTDDDG